MKKSKKLVLRKETVEVLSQSSLEAANGGLTPVTVPIIFGFTVGLTVGKEL